MSEVTVDHDAGRVHDGPAAESEAPSTAFSIALVTTLVNAGVRDIVVSPGSRSQALALVAAELERAGAVDLHVRIDERCAGFLALGLALESRAPVAVITTSGTATANLFPAILEAHHSGVPLIALTADRPEEMRGIGANQTTDQTGIYGAAVRWAIDVAAPTDHTDGAHAQALAQRAIEIARGSTPTGPGPIHLNLGFREPLSSAVRDLSREFADRSHGSDPGAQSPAPAQTESIVPSEIENRFSPEYSVPAGEGTVVVAGANAGDEAERVARAGGWPLFAEVSSGARFGPNLVVCYPDLLCNREFSNRIDRVIVFGHPTLSREVPALIATAATETIVVASPGADWYNPGHAVTHFTLSIRVHNSTDTVPPSVADREWLASSVAASRAAFDGRGDEGRDSSLVAPGGDGPARGSGTAAANRRSRAREDLSSAREPVTRRMLVDAVWRNTWPHDRLVFGASRLIRVADATVLGKKIRVHSNRGLSGIDGTVSTGLGVAIASQRDGAAGITRVLLGDLALLHDVGGMLISPGETRPLVQVVVGNDGAGTIFADLEVAATADPAAMSRVLLTPQQADFAGFARAYGWEYRAATNRSELERALTERTVGPTMIDVRLEDN